MNNCVLIGRLVKDPDIAYTQAKNTAVCKFTLAVDRYGQDGADFIRIVAWGKTAENCARYLSKGRQVAIQGRIQTGSYKNQDGQTVYTTDVIANNVQFLGKGQEQSQPVADDAGFDEIDDVPEFSAVQEEIPF